ncbi:MAG TPA: hypothetical protein VH143_20505 [Kofleriaceae bacterium]|jgi:hypothetical protein|nr:hypothetical protein [Kofleriaceae bacterium]
MRASYDFERARSQAAALQLLAAARERGDQLATTAGATSPFGRAIDVVAAALGCGRGVRPVAAAADPNTGARQRRLFGLEDAEADHRPFNAAVLACGLRTSFRVIVDHCQSTRAIANVLVLLAALGNAGLARGLDSLLRSQPDDARAERFDLFACDYRVAHGSVVVAEAVARPSSSAHRVPSDHHEVSRTYKSDLALRG